MTTHTKAKANVKDILLKSTNVMTTTQTHTVLIRNTIAWVRCSYLIYYDWANIFLPFCQKDKTITVRIFWRVEVASPGLKPILCWSETPELEFGAQNLTTLIEPTVNKLLTWLLSVFVFVSSRCSRATVNFSLQDDKRRNIINWKSKKILLRSLPLAVNKKQQKDQCG